MRNIHKSSGRFILAAAMLFSLFLSSCEDHRVPPTQQNLPDRIFYALSSDNQIHEINVRNTSSPIRSFPVILPGSDEKLLGIDFRPATGQLYAISSANKIYQINVKTGDKEGFAKQIGSMPLAVSLVGHIGFDFNPTVDKIRVVSSTRQNLRVNPETGAIVPTGPDGNLQGYDNPMIGAVAYTNSRAGVTASPGVGTALFDIDPSTDMLYKQDPPNPGGLVEIGSLGINIEEVGGFDISPDIAPSDVFPIASVKIGGNWELSLVNLSTGKLQKLGDLPAGKDIIGIAIPSLPVAYALEAGNVLRIFDPVSGTEYGTKTISGLTGVELVGIDIRPNNGRLYAVAKDDGIYTVDLGNGIGSRIGSLVNASNGMAVTPTGTIFGVDFNPVADLLRVVSNTGINLRINVETGNTNVDGPLNIASVPAMDIVAGAYTNSYPGIAAAPGGAGTTLFDIQGSTSTLFKQVPPNDGTLTDPKSIGVAFTGAAGFDIGNVSGKGYAILTVGGAPKLYTVDLATGAATLVRNAPAPAMGLALGFGL